LEELKPFEPSHNLPGAAGAEEMKKTHERLVEIFAEFLCDACLERFKRPGGVAGLGNFLKHRAEVWLMFTRGTAFHKPDCRARLLSIAKQHDEVAAQNFYVYLRMLVGDMGLVESPLRDDAELVVAAWEAASRVRPQPKMKGEVIELVKRLRAALKNNDAIKIPKWVESAAEDEAEVTSSAQGDDSPAD
ncbi:MAG TPA: hypothetical protein VGQ34_03580, partial [Sphingomicrobium sp.]|jgi:hypothetical protein|nr:hypothetical protein [Sphingomicrobium sp.]